MPQTAPPGVFEMLKIGVGPSSSHTLGPWRAAREFVQQLATESDAAPRGPTLSAVSRIAVHLYGSLALTGTGHGTDIAVMMGLTGADPETVDLDQVRGEPARARQDRRITLAGVHRIPFDPDTDIVFHRTEQLPGHANGMRFEARGAGDEVLHEVVAYSIGGGFVAWDAVEPEAGVDAPDRRPYELSSGARLIAACRQSHGTIAAVARANERAAGRDDGAIDARLTTIWRVMREAVHRGCSRDGTLPGGLEVTRRAPALARRLTGTRVPDDVAAWLEELGRASHDFSRVLKLVGCFAIAVNEENAAFGRVVTAPTNGSAGVIPAVALYYRYLADRPDGSPVSDTDILDFLLVAGVVGGIFKTGATISAAMGGCQAEIGVSSAMAAAALAEGLGGTPEQAVMAAEIAMEHHLGLTCDPIGGLVQVPCIERNSMGAVKAITAAHIAIESDTTRAKVSLDEVVRTMWSTAQDMDRRYKETSLGGLAANVSVRVPEC